ncbi:MAG: hypothetical protein LBT78_12495 [Tannerella sp.]|nr:hypothetical protein [Tannerella sp.]
MIEKGTNYSFLIRTQQDLTFRKVRAVSEQFIRDLPQDLREVLLGEIKCGSKLMESEPSMAAYLHTYGDICEARLQRALTCLPVPFPGRETELIDYDCDQAVSIMIYHDFLKNRNLSQTIRRITLIHPSETCLKRAVLHAHQFFPQAEIRPICKPVYVLQAEDISTDNPWAKVHLLTNIRNLDTVSATRLAELIRANLNGYNQFVCVSPFYGETSESTARLDAFVELLDTDAGTYFSENLKSNQLVADKPWTCSLRVFTTGEAEEDISHSDPEVEAATTSAESPVTDGEAEETKKIADETCELTNFDGEIIAADEKITEGDEEAAIQPAESLTDEEVEEEEQEAEEATNGTCELTNFDGETTVFDEETTNDDETGITGREITAVNEETTVAAPKTTDEPTAVREPEPVDLDPLLQLRASAEQGNAKAQNNLGFLYEVGQGVPQDDGEAVKWYRKAAEQGHAKAQYNLANHYSRGLGVPQNDAEAVKWYLEAANKGVLNAMNNLGAMYAIGRGVEKNEAEAVKWYRIAAGQGDETAIRNLQKRVRSQEFR